MIDLPLHEADQNSVKKVKQTKKVENVPMLKNKINGQFLKPSMDF